MIRLRAGENGCSGLTLYSPGTCSGNAGNDRMNLESNRIERKVGQQQKTTELRRFWCLNSFQMVKRNEFTN